MENKKPFLKGKTPYDAIDELSHTNSASATDCTGLILRPAENEDELQAYADIYDFGPIDKN